VGAAAIGTLIQPGADSASAFARPECGQLASMMATLQASNSDSLLGLSSEQAACRLAANGLNMLPGSRPKSSAKIVLEVISEPMFLMLLAAGGIYLTLGDRAEALFLLVLHEGDRIAADALLLDGQLSVDESLLSGEAVPVTKLASVDGAAAAFGAPGGDGTVYLFASTVVTRGVGLAQVHATAAATAAATAVRQIGDALNTSSELPSALQRASR
jgi:P-type Ca2+ transporter type 2C